MKPDPYLTPRARPPAPPMKPKPLRPANKAEVRMVERGARSGYLAGRYGGTLLERLHPARPCPYPNEGRPRALWMAGYRLGVPRGTQDRAAVQRSFRAGLEQLEAGRQ
jgi:hypothetical protein